MIPLKQLLSRLGYAQSPHYYHVTVDRLKPEIMHLFRAVRDVGKEGRSKVDGIYVFKTSPNSELILLPERPAVYVIEANDIEEARQIHRKLWNLSYVPFLIIRLPHQIRVYTGFKYSSDESKEEGLLVEIDNQSQLHLLTNFTAISIDSGNIWKKYAGELNPNDRVDKRLLNNLEELGGALKEDGLRDEVAHALIGKYVYLSYLKDRNILTEAWLLEQQITTEDVFSFNATVSGLQKLVQALENRVNGKIFPIDFDKEDTLKDKHVSWVASIFSGSKIMSIDAAPKIVRQLYLPFKAYDFRYIPVETFSAIYEQFIHDRKKKGAIYTPEVLADYLLSVVEWVKPLKQGAKIFDPACGSGVFLVLAYQRLIEMELERQGEEKLSPEKLCDILLESIYGVEREQDACYVTEFSLILMLLHYAEPSELERLAFQFPDLHNRQIFQSDFFDLAGEESEAKFWQQALKFDWIVGNPPWIDSSKDEKNFVDTWIHNPENEIQYPVGGNSVAEAFSWLITELLGDDGIAGIVMPATSLFNIKSQKYRQRFFTKYEILHITNFANLREVLFGRRATLPAATIVYRWVTDEREKSDIIHYGPLSINQVSETKEQTWVITVNENEIQIISPDEAEKGETSLWKLALWGTYLDKRAIERIKHLFPNTLEKICKKRNWAFHGDIQLRKANEESNYELKYIPELVNKKRFRADPMRQSLFRFSIPQGVLEDIPKEMCYIRKRGGETGLKVVSAPHIILSPSWMSYIIYSNEDFVIAPKHIGIAASEEDADELRAYALYLSSSLAAYYLFFHAHEWGVFRQAKWVSITEVGKIPTPELTSKQVEELSQFHKKLVDIERQRILDFTLEWQESRQKSLDFDDLLGTETITKEDPLTDLTYIGKREAENFVSKLQTELHKEIDEKIFNLFNVTEDIRVLVNEFVQIRLSLDTLSATEKITQRPTKLQLLAYARELQVELDNFVMGTSHHRVTITNSEELIGCTIEVTKEKTPIHISENSIEEADFTTAKLLTEVSENLKEQVSQWVYVKRGLRFFDGSRIYIYKTPRLIDWTRTQAMNDANEIIGQIIETEWETDEND